MRKPLGAALALALAVAPLITPQPSSAATPCSHQGGTVSLPAGTTIWASIENPGIDPVTFNNAVELPFVAFCQDANGSWYIVLYNNKRYTASL